MLTLKTVLLILALVCFCMAAANVNSGRVNLLATGLALFVISLLVTV